MATKKNNLKHSKKRNAGIVYEILVREIAKSVLEHNEKRGSLALRLLKKWFRPGTEIAKEFRLLNSLVQTRNLSEQSANHFIDIVRKASVSSQFDMVQLDKEQSLAIRDINHSFGEKIWEHKIENYRDIATAQMLLNHWRTPLVENINQILEYEDHISKLLISSVTVKEKTNEHVSIGEGKQLLRILEKKINEKWGNVLSERQKVLVREWSLSNTEFVVKELQNIKSEFEKKAVQFSIFESDSELKNKMQEAVKALSAETIAEQINEEQVSRFLVYIKLIDELNS
jgi:hypothetical protein